VKTLALVAWIRFEIFSKFIQHDNDPTPFRKCGTYCMTISEYNRYHLNLPLPSEFYFASGEAVLIQAASGSVQLLRGTLLD
jgi:hypothetical protein